MMTSKCQSIALSCVALMSLCHPASPFKSTNFQATGSARRHSRPPIDLVQRDASSCIIRLAKENDSVSDVIEKRFTAASIESNEIIVSSGKTEVSTSDDSKAATSTVNERLMTELQEAVDTEKYGSKKKRDLFKDFRSEKTEEERMRSIEEARDLNGINPLVCIGGAAFAWVCAGGLWLLTTNLGGFFAMHPPDTDVYFIQRLTGVFRNVVMGISSLASGFFGVIGLGVFLLGGRVALGVMSGELDPTPIKVPKSEEFVLPDVWGLMMGKKPNRRR